MKNEDEMRYAGSTQSRGTNVCFYLVSSDSGVKDTFKKTTSS
jgi:hypothetical protein